MPERQHIADQTGWRSSKLIKEALGWTKTVKAQLSARHRWLPKIDRQFSLILAA